MCISSKNQPVHREYTIFYICNYVQRSTALPILRRDYSRDAKNPELFPNQEKIRQNPDLLRKDWKTRKKFFYAEFRFEKGVKTSEFHSASIDVNLIVLPNLGREQNEVRFNM